MEEYLNGNGNEINGTNGTDDPVAEPETAPAEVPEIGETAPTEAPDAAEERETAAAPGEGAAPIYGSTPAPEGAPAPEEAPAERTAGPSPYFNNLTFRPREERPAGQEYDARQAQTPGYAAYGAGQYQQPPQYAPYGGGQPMDRPPVYPGHAAYGVPNVGGGGISYAPVQDAPHKKPPKKKGKGWVVILVAVCVLLSFGSGFIGAYVAGVSGQLGQSTPSGTTVIQKVDNSDKEGGSTKTESSTYAAVVEKIRDSVVEIETEYRTTGWFQYVTGGAGSGVIISEDGYIVTNNHVICGNDDTTEADSIKVRLRSGEEYDAKVIGKDADADIAVIKVEATGLEAATFGDSDELDVGDEVIAIGNPLGELGGTVTNGIISALAREIEVEGKKMTLLQTNTAINPGNSGGGLFNLKGELIGIVNAKSSGSEIEGLAFAIPANDAFNTSTQLMEYGYVRGKPIVGVTLYNVNSAYRAAQLGVGALGVYISDVVEGYNDKVLKVKDRILAVDGQEVASGEDVIEKIKAATVGDKMTFTIYRDGEMKEVEVTVFENTGD